MREALGYWLVGTASMVLLAGAATSLRSWMRLRRMLARRRQPLVVLFGKEDDRGLN